MTVWQLRQEPPSSCARLSNFIFSCRWQRRYRRSPIWLSIATFVHTHTRNDVICSTPATTWRYETEIQSLERFLAITTCIGKLLPPPHYHFQCNRSSHPCSFTVCFIGIISHAATFGLFADDLSALFDIKHVIRHTKLSVVLFLCVSRHHFHRQWM